MEKPLRFELQKALGPKTAQELETANAAADSAAKAAGTFNSASTPIISSDTRARAGKIFLKKHPYALELTTQGKSFPN